jgi:diguanylate cyclase (GGDEF)-like protein
MNLDLAITNLETITPEIRRLSLVDDKTLLLNSLALNKEIPSFEDGQSKFNTIVFGDINDFKKLNDTEGHEAGDFAIKRIGEKIQSDFVQKLNAKAFRQSGDEFVILLTQESIEDFKKAALDFKTVSFLYNAKTLITKISFGLSVSDGKATFNDLLKRAETACLTAKTEGNGVCVTWNTDIEQNSLIDFREKCKKCGSVNKCNVPKTENPQKLSVCSFCRESFT